MKKKKIGQRMANPQQARQRKLELARETVRTLGEHELSQAVGGSACNTTSYTTERLSTRC